jgi:hypothetical protein
MMAAQLPRNYLCVFYADPKVGDDVVDLGRDPDFSPPVPTWGICRPAVRSKWVKQGSHVVFVGYYGANRYLVKGWIRVGEVLTYADALERFPSRRNVIIRPLEETEYAARTPSWKRKDIAVAVEAKFGNRPPAFLTTIHSGNRTFVQNPDDDHELDNWKCQRIFLDTTNQLLRCIDAGTCLRENRFSALKGYVVADAWQDVGNARIPWCEVAPPSLLGSPLQTPYHQHNERRLRDDDLDVLRHRLASLSGGRLSGL